jgi:hypothetical protein
MKKLCLSLLCAGVMFSGGAMAQTCAAPGSWTPDPSGDPSVSADLCGTSDDVALYCDFLDSAGKNDAIWQINVAAGFTATAINVAGTAAGFNPVLYMYTSGCAVGGGCFETGSDGAPLQMAAAGPGAYFLGVSAASSDATGACGSVTLSTDGTFPIALQSFSVE